MKGGKSKDCRSTLRFKADQRLLPPLPLQRLHVLHADTTLPRITMAIAVLWCRTIKALTHRAETEEAGGWEEEEEAAAG